MRFHVDYAACRDALERVEADLGAAEFHGTACAMLCTRPDPQPDAWVDEIVVTEHRPQSRNWLLPLSESVEDSRRAFNDGNYSLQLLLPDDDVPLDERSRALSDWCSGFLFGLGLAGAGVTEALSDDAREVVVDLTEFTRIDAEDDGSQSAEKAFLEIVEYVRVGVLLIYEELMRTGAVAAGQTRLH
jgi:uncharacterized protein YgfB (UPF0149 family)